MNTLDIVLINIICYMGGFFSGIGIFLKYKHALLIKTHSHSELQNLVNNLTNDIQNHTSLGAPTPPLIASAPPVNDLKEIIIRNN